MNTKNYFERMDQEWRVQPLLMDSTACEMATPVGHYAIANSAGEVLFIGNSGIKGIQRL